MNVITVSHAALGSTWNTASVAMALFTPTVLDVKMFAGFILAYIWSLLQHIVVLDGLPGVSGLQSPSAEMVCWETESSCEGAKYGHRNRSKTKWSNRVKMERKVFYGEKSQGIVVLIKIELQQ